MAPDNCLMQGFEPADQQLLDAAAVAGHLVPESPVWRVTVLGDGEA
jgi:hypothetical protein